MIADCRLRTGASPCEVAPIREVAVTRIVLLLALLTPTLMLAAQGCPSDDDPAADEAEATAEPATAPV